jgi:hypothetical protein
LNNCKSIIDLGAGIGASTAAMKMIYLDSEVYYHNLEGNQYNFAKKLFNKLNLNIQEVLDYSSIMKNIEVVLAFDYFEHFERPVDELNKVISVLNPKFIFESSDFSHAFIGHFENYIVDKDIIFHKKMRKIFEKSLIENGYRLNKVTLSNACWNREPKVWERL